MDFKKSFCWRLNQGNFRSENGPGFFRPSLKTGVENDIFGSELGSGFRVPDGTPLPRFHGSTPRIEKYQHVDSLTILTKSYSS